MSRSALPVRREATRLLELSARLIRSGLTALRIRPRELPIQRLLIGGVTSLGIGLGAPESHAEAPEPAPAAKDDAGTPSVLPPRALTELSAEYPPGASGAHESVVELVVGVDGTPRDVRVLDGVSPFAEAALAAAAAWRFAPAERGGQPVPARIRLKVSFIDPGPESVEASIPGSAGVGRGPDANSAGSPSPPPPPGVENAPSAGASANPPAPLPAEPLEVTVSGVRAQSPKRMTRAEVREMPGAFGDAFRAIEAMPGVTPIASGLPYFFVRGAPPGNLGYLLDGLSLPSLYHAAVGPSVIHPAFIESVELYSGAYPARYGRFAGAVIAGTSRAPSYEWRGEASVRLVDSGAFLELPFADRKGSLMLAGRYSYTAALVSLLVPEVEIGYWDYQARATYRPTERDTLTVFGFGAHDFLSAEDDGERQTVYDVTFHRLDANWRRSLPRDSALLLGTTLGWDQTGSGADDTLALDSRRIGGRALYTNQLGSRVLLRAGGDVELSRFGIDITENPDDDDDDDDGAGFNPELEELPYAALPIADFQQRPLTRQSFTDLFASRTDALFGGWVDAVLDLGQGVTLTPGFRFDVYASRGTPKLAPEPRLSVRYQIASRLALVHDLGVAHQAPSFAIPVPGFSGTAAEGLQRGVQTSAGVEWLPSDGTRVEVTLFQTALLRGSDPIGVYQLDNADLSVDALTDRVTAHTYGAELYLRRDLTRRLGGFLSYTLSRSTRSVARLEGPSSVDRTHVVNVAASYRLGDSWRTGARVMFYSGVPAEVAYPRAALSPPRGPVFHRVDWRLEKRWRLGDDGFWALVAEVQNTTLRRETLDVSCYAYGCDTEGIGPITVPSLGIEAQF
jgi:hypothetical protein